MTENETTMRRPDRRSEARLDQLREQGRAGLVQDAGVAPAGAPIPLQPSPTQGYYHVHMMKEPQWTHEIPVYFFVGGAGGAAAVIAEVAALTGANRKLVADARTIAAAGAIISPVLLISDLGRSSRFINMLRVFKPQSAMSVGTYIVTVYGTAAFATKAAELLHERLGWGLFTFAEHAAGVVSAVAGLGMATYTGVLIGATAITVWNRHVHTLPIHFAMSGLGAAVGTLELMGNTGSRALNTLGLMNSAIETWEGAEIEIRRGDYVTEPLRQGLSGWLMRSAGLLSGPVPLVLRAVAAFSGSGRSRKLRRIAGACSVAGSMLTRLAWIRAGHASARDWRVPLQLEPSQRSLPDKSRPGYQAVGAAD